MLLISRTLIFTALITTLTGVSCFAQGHGVSGPDKNGYKTNTDELVLTRPRFQQILGDCMEVELLELSKIIAKNEHLAREYDNNDKVHTLDGLPGTSDGLTVNRDFITPGGIVDYAAISSYVVMRATDYNNEPMTFHFYRNKDSINFEFYTLTMPRIEYKETSLKDPQNPSGDPIDDLGSVIQEKVIVTNFRWVNSANPNLPADLSSELPLYNSTSRVKVPGLTFNQPRYVQCVNLKLGNYAPVSP